MKSTKIWILCAAIGSALVLVAAGGCEEQASDEAELAPPEMPEPAEQAAPEPLPSPQGAEGAAPPPGAEPGGEPGGEPMPGAGEPLDDEPAPEPPPAP